MRAVPVLVVLACLSVSAEAYARSSPFDASVTGGLVFRSITVPSNLDVCVSIGKYCPMVGSLDSKSAHVEGFGGLFRTNLLKEGPLRIGAEVTLGGTTSGVDGMYGTSVVRVDNFFFTTAGVGIGLATGFDRVRLGVDGFVGVSIVKAGTSLRTLDGLPLSVMSTNGYLEARGTISYFISPHVAVAAFGGVGLNQIWHTGLSLSVYFDANDKNR
jgi:hypothetical protein